MTIELRSASRTDVGRARERNEDAYYAGSHVFAVADGLGGHRAGEVASHLALESLTPLDGVDPDRAADKLADAVRRANRNVYERAEAEPGLKGMGTTLTAVVIANGSAHLAHVGDSRCYLIRGPEIAQLSADHTLVARMVSEGKLTREQAETHPQRSILTRALGAERDVDVDQAEFPLRPGDRLVLCSDGLSGVLTDEEIRQLAAPGADLEEIAGHLIDEANARGGPDNITAVVVDIGGSFVAAAPKAERPIGFARRPDVRGARMSKRPFVWAAAIIIAVVAGYLTVRTTTQRSFYVGVTEDRVTIYRGVPVEFAGIKLYSEEEPTTIARDEVAEYYLPRLEDGVRADTLDDARRIVSQIPLDPASLPDPKPSKRRTPLPTPTGGPSP